MDNPAYIDWDYVRNYDKPKKEKLEGTIVDIRPIMTYYTLRREDGISFVSDDIDEGIFKALRTKNDINFLGCNLESFCTGKDFLEFTPKDINGEELEESIVFLFEPEKEMLSTVIHPKYKELIEEFYNTQADKGMFDGYNYYNRNVCEPDLITIELDTTEAFNEALRSTFKDYVHMTYYEYLFTK